MDITPLLPREHVLIGVGGNTQRAILQELAGPLVRDHTIADADRFLQELAARESQVTTQIVGGVAFPHARCQGVRGLALVVGTAPNPGLPFSGPDRELCRLFFLIAVPPSAPTAHLPLLQYLSLLVRHESRVSRLLAAHTPAQAVRLLCGLKR